MKGFLRIFWDGTWPACDFLLFCTIIFRLTTFPLCLSTANASSHLYYNLCVFDNALLRFLASMSPKTHFLFLFLSR
ncbi:hypothetical protein BDW74DRAFT_91170 [Aspergillus multicolor]|uniref:uncharacterized protein n=1 Tax=Aspergillus multicolor TaxID=41759 RepID=UPI003CCC90E8